MRFVAWDCPAIPDSEISKLSIKHGASPFTVRAMLRRGIRTDEEITRFLHPEDCSFSDPNELDGMAEALELIQRELACHTKICVYGDYDCDGICGTAILVSALRDLGADVCYYIPSRHNEGYGMNADAVRSLHEKGVGLIVTVDNGISAFNEMRLCHELGMRCVISDHHLKQSVLPEADALVCPSDSMGEDKNFCGTVVAWKLACALGCPRPDSYLGLCALATVADVVPLAGENRSIVARGLKRLGDNRGLAALMKAAGVTRYDSESLAYALSPRMNAAGRMGSASRAVELLLCEDSLCAQTLANELDYENTQRRLEEQRISEDCERQLKERNLEDCFALVLVGENWNAGVIGIVASRLTEKLHRPVMLFTPLGEQLSGSGRSIEGVDLFCALSECKELLIRYGGHARAAGAAVEPGRLAEFAQSLSDAVKKLTGGVLPEAELVYEEELEVTDVNTELGQAIARLAPFGEGNPEPIFLLRRYSIAQLSPLGQNGRHLQLQLQSKLGRARLVAFGFRSRQSELESFGLCDVLVRAALNSYRGRTNCELYCVEIAKYGTAEQKTCPNGKIVDAIYHSMKYNNLCDYASMLAGKLADIRFGEEQLRACYVDLRERLRARPCAWRELDYTAAERLALLVFLELGFFDEDEAQRITVVDRPEKRRLEESLIFGALQTGAEESIK